MNVDGGESNNGDSEPLLRDPSRYDIYGSSESRTTRNGSPQEPQLHIRTYKKRFYILFLFSLMACLQCLEWNTWGPISQSVEAAFPDWSSSTVAMMGNWGTITFVIFSLPLMKLLHTCGLRTGVLTCALLMASGTSLRCFTMQSPGFTILSHFCAILVGTSGTIVMAAPPLLALLWFPPNQRTSATAFAQAFNQLGSVVSYLQPLLVRAPGLDVDPELIRMDIRRLMFYTAGVSVGLFLCLLLWFPSRPRLPPSVTSTTDRFEFRSGLRNLMRKNFLLIWLSYSLFIGLPAAWMSVLNYSFLTFGIEQAEAMHIGILAVSCSCVSALVSGRFSDYFYGNIKKVLIVLISVAFLAFTVFLLITMNVITPSKWKIYASVILGVSANFATSPLFFELGVESSYPVPESVVGGVLTCGNNFVGILFLLLFFIHTTNYTWVTICLVAGSFFSLFPLMLVKEVYLRSSIDRS